MRVSVVAPAREDDRPVEEVLDVAQVADRLGYPEVWLGEGATWDSFVAAAAVGFSTEQIEVTAGPIPVSVRDPVTIGRGAASVATVTGRSTGVALGAASTRVVEGLHGRSRKRVVSDLAESAAAVRRYLHDPPRDDDGAAAEAGFRTRMRRPGGSLTVAAFGDRAIAIAAEHADRMLLDLVSPEQVAILRAKLDDAARRLQRPRPALSAWLPTAVDPVEESVEQVRRSIVRYLTVRGYDEMFIAAGFEEAVQLARQGRDGAELLRSLPDGAERTVGLVGDRDSVRAGMQMYADSGLDEVALVPSTAGDPSAIRTLTALAPR